MRAYRCAFSESERNVNRSLKKLTLLLGSSNNLGIPWSLKSGIRPRVWVVWRKVDNEDVFSLLEDLSSFIDL